MASPAGPDGHPDALIAALGLEPHPEGGHYRETWCHVAPSGQRGAGTAIYVLYRAGESARWHRVLDADEVWHHYAGGPLQLATWDPAGGPVERTVLGPDVIGGQRPQAVVPAGWWQAAEPVAGWALCGCTVSPAFTFESFELAPPGWRPPPAG